MSFQKTSRPTQLEINDLDGFTKAIAGQLSYAACVISGYGIEAAYELPSFKIEVEGQPRKAFIRESTASSYITSVWMKTKVASTLLPTHLKTALRG
jgi:hypothetical protein